MRNILLVILFLLAGCNMTTVEGVKTGQDLSTIQITSNDFSGIQVQVDNSEVFSISDMTSKSKGTVEWDVNPGKHIVTIWKNGNIQLQRQIFLGNGLIKEFIIQ
jgi:predicted small secreted protein